MNNLSKDYIRMCVTCRSFNFIKFHAVLELFEANSGFFKCLSALETTRNNQEVKRSLHRLQNVNNLPKDYIRVCLTCRSLAELFNFFGLVELQEYI